MPREYLKKDDDEKNETILLTVLAKKSKMNIE